MYYIGKIWEHDSLKKEIVYTADNDIVAIQKLSAAIPNGCRGTYEEITKEKALCLMEKGLTDPKEEDHQIKAKD